MLFVVVALHVVSQQAQLVPDDKAQQAAAIVGKTARAFYARWGVSPADDAALLAEIVDAALAQEIRTQRRTCAQGTGTCVDRMTCMAERANVERVMFQRTSTTALLQADVELQGVTTKSRATARWEIRVSAAGSRVTAVRCQSATLSAPAPAQPGGAAATPPTAAPKFQSKVRARSAREGDIIAYLQESTEAGHDADRIRAVLRKWYSPAGQKSYVNFIQNVCVANAKLGADSNETCDGNAMMCTDENVILESLSVDGSGVATALFHTASGGRRRVTLFLEDDASQGMISNNFCADPDGPPPPSGPTEFGSTFASPKRPGHCSGFATCKLSCTESGCYRGTTGRCMGSPTPCSSRSQSACFDGCTWSQ